MTFRETCAEVKARVKIEQVANLFLKLTPENGTYRANCVCGQGGDRAIIITPAKGVFHCFSCKASGSVIALVMLCKSCTAQEAVEWFMEDMPEVSSNRDSSVKI